MRSVSVVSSAAVVVGCLVAVGASAQRPSLGGLETEHDTLQSAHDTLQSAHDALQTQHDALQTQHDALRAEHDALLADTCFLSDETRPGYRPLQCAAACDWLADESVTSWIACVEPIPTPGAYSLQWWADIGPCSGMYCTGSSYGGCGPGKECPAGESCDSNGRCYALCGSDCLVVRGGTLTGVDAGSTQPVSAEKDGVTTIINQNDALACLAQAAAALGTCTSQCGNGLVGFGEQCDDGNTSPGDGCSASCQLE